MFLFLDDERLPTDVTWVDIPKVDWEIVRTYSAFVSTISCLSQPPAHISFDHDLGYGNGKPDHLEFNGYDCAKFLVEICMIRKWPLPAYTVHSMNPVGKQNIESLLNNFKNFLSFNR